ncbi:MAG: ABC transporter permease [Coriobacteriia bacterium]|nr:ABC transporter permease [Coriobacteriia bacterium]
MEIYITAVTDAFSLLTGANPTVWQVIALSLLVSGSAICIATLIGVPLGYLLGMSRFAGRGVLVLLINTAMGFPPVVIGLFVYMALSRSGPLGGLQWLFTPQGMIMAQVILASPLVIGVSAAAIAGVPRDLRLQLRALGASRIQEGYEVLKEARGGVIVAIIAGFGAIISEVGAVSIVGGGIEGYTDVMTTAIMANVRRGELPQAMAWAVVLMGIALVVNVALTSLQSTGNSYDR